MGRYSIPLYGIVLVGAMVFGLGVPIGAANMEHFGDLLLITLIYATFISVSLIHIIAGVRDGRSLIDAPHGAQVHRMGIDCGGHNRVVGPPGRLVGLRVTRRRGFPGR